MLELGTRQNHFDICNLNEWNGPTGSSEVRVESLVAKSCLTLCDLMDCSLPCSSVHGILQARILECVAIPFSRGSSDPGIEPMSPALAGGFFTSESLGNPVR